MAIRPPFNLTAPRLTPITRAALWIVLSGICSVMMNVLIRIAAQGLHPFEVAFFRCLFGLVFVLPWIVKSGAALWRHRMAGFYLLRASIGLVSMATWFLRDHRGAVGDGDRRQLHRTSLRHSGGRPDPSGGRPISALERGRARLCRGARHHAPGQRADRCEPADLVALRGDGGDEQHYGQVPIAQRAAEHDRRFLHDLSHAVVADPGFFVWRWPDLSTFGALVGLGCLGTIAHISVARALAAADASACAPFEFARLPFAALIGFLWFGEITDLWTWVGAAIIAGSAVYVAHREALLARRARRDEPRAPALSPAKKLAETLAITAMAAAGPFRVRFRRSRAQGGCRGR